MKRAIIAAASALLVLVTPSCDRQEKALAELRQGFCEPPADCRPRVWWHWMNGNITREGIRSDIEWMHRAGIGGFHVFDAGISTPQIVENRLVYMTPEWQDAFGYALDLADSLGIEVSIASSPGWSITGGPWVSADDAEKKLAWSETDVQGGSRLELALPCPPTNFGPYQEERGGLNALDSLAMYRDLCVLAVRLSGEGDSPRVLNHEYKSGFKVDYQVDLGEATPECSGAPALEDVVDVTAFCKEGILSWDAPEGRWKILRIGWNLLGRVNGPASPEATGFEVDKLDADAVRRYYDAYLGMYQQASGGRLGKSIHCLMIDSYESGRATWTPRMEEEFLARRGYALRPWMPVLTGLVIGSAEQSEQFLFDWRRTLGELMAENHYDIVDDILRPYGMRRHTESHEERRAFVGDGMMVKRHADIPMGAFWVRTRAGWYSTYPGCEADLKESSSVAHVFGSNLCAAESFTTNGKIGKWDGTEAYRCTPRVLKPVADAAMAQGLNQFIIHCSVHQPSDEHIPGLGLGTYGQWFTRHETWAEEARPWTDYLARSSFMLRQGRYVADVAYLYGEDTNPTARFYDERLDFPRGWSYDFVNSDILCNELKASEGTLTAASGMSYRMLVVDGRMGRMSQDLQDALAKAKDAGVAVVDAADMAQALLQHGMEPDVAGMPDSLSYVHRTLPCGEIYWVANICSHARSMELSFRCSGLEPEIWNAADCSMRPATYRMEGGRTVVKLDFERDDALFVVFSGKAKADGQTVESPVRNCETAVAGSWSVHLDQKHGGSKTLEMAELEDLSKNGDPFVKYFSGTATYSTDFEFDGCTEDALLDLGEVCDMARVVLNGTDLGLAWKRPYRLAASSLRQGTNHLEIKVINSWGNRLLGDCTAAEKITYTVQQFYTPDFSPAPAGLSGPVRVLSCRQ